MVNWLLSAWPVPASAVVFVFFVFLANKHKPWRGFARRARYEPARKTRSVTSL